MKIIHINENDQKGGAALAVSRLHNAMREFGLDSRILVQHKNSTDDYVESFSTGLRDDTKFQMDIIERVYRDRNRTDISNTHFSLSFLGVDITSLPIIQNADILHLHWVASFLTPQNIQSLLELNKPIVWTLHDMEPFTGGCHYSAGCDKYKSDCSSCPQLQNDPFGITTAILNDKKTLWSPYTINFISPSKWLADCARESSIFTIKNKINIIPNTINTRIFQPQSKLIARSQLNLPEQGRLILCGGDQGQEKRKGFDILDRVLRNCLKDLRFTTDTHIVWVGTPPSMWTESNMPFISLGRLNCENDMALAYSAADLFVLTSQEDNLPNMMLESLSCGTPVVGFAVGGIPDVLIDGWNGRLITPFDESAMTEAILSLLTNPDELKRMQSHGSVFIEEHYSNSKIVKKHIELYDSLLSSNHSFKKIND